jgi:hypothetical protein
MDIILLDWAVEVAYELEIYRWLWLHNPGRPQTSWEAERRWLSDRKTVQLACEQRSDAKCNES